MAATDPGKPLECYACGWKFCQGDCKPCPRRKAGTCTNLVLRITEREGPVVVYRAVCPSCYHDSHGTNP